MCAEFPDESLPKLLVPKQVSYSRIGLTAQTLIVSSLLCLCLFNNILQVLFKNKIQKILNEAVIFVRRRRNNLQAGTQRFQ